MRLLTFDTVVIFIGVGVFDDVKVAFNENESFNIHSIHSRNHKNHRKACGFDIQTEVIIISKSWYFKLSLKLNYLGWT